MNLSRPDRRERLDLLAAEYALGTLPPRARSRLSAIARTDVVVSSALRQWEQRLAGLAMAVPPVQPPPRLWRGIRARLGFEAPAQDEGGWWRRLSFWRGLAVMSFVAAVALGVARYLEPPASTGAPLIVVLAGPDAKPVMVATAQRGDRFLNLKLVAPADPGTGKAFELWALPDGQNPRSLGVIPSGGVVRLPLPAPADQSLGAVPALAVSVEPSGGSPTGAPTGPVLYTGKVERMY